MRRIYGARLRVVFIVKLFFAILVSIFSTTNAFADNYIIGGAGVAETCAVDDVNTSTNDVIGESDDCSNPTLLLRGALGKEINRYLFIEGSADALVHSVIPRRYSHSTKDKVSVLTIGVSAFATLPITDSFRFFVGPSLGVSMSRVSINTTVWENNSNEETGGSNNTNFGTNYGWAAGVDIGTLDDGIVRLQWQNWRSIDSDIAFGGEFDTNALSLNYIVRY